MTQLPMKISIGRQIHNMIQITTTETETFINPMTVDKVMINTTLAMITMTTTELALNLLQCQGGNQSQ